MLTSKTIMQKIQKNITQIKKFGVKKIGLFGSFINNNQTNNSDIDLLVEFKKGQKSFDNYMDLKFFLEELFNRRVDLVITGAIKPDLKPYILGNAQYVTGV
jgi:predicted nucleotidyltransferase